MREEFTPQSLVVHFDISSKKTEGLICLFSDNIYMCFPQRRSSDIVTPRYLAADSLSSSMEEILRGNGSLESGNMKDLAFCGVNVRVPALFPLLKFTEVFLKDICFLRGA